MINQVNVATIDPTSTKSTTTINNMALNISMTPSPNTKPHAIADTIDECRYLTV